MNNFELAIKELLGEEGGYVYDPKDPGGETNCGISKRSYPTLDIKNLTKQQITDIYYRDFWVKGGYESIISAVIATKMLSMSVNFGISEANMLLQRSCWAVPEGFYNCVPDDGVLGKITMTRVNLANPEYLMIGLKAHCDAFYRELIDRNNSFFRFKFGWLKRAYYSLKTVKQGQ